jgi:hypothetical protein
MLRPGCSEGEQQAFREGLSHHAQRRCAQRAAHGKFPRAAGSAREQHVSQVHAGDEQNEPNGGEKDEHQRVQVAENRLCERMHGDAMLVTGKLSIDLRLNAG